MVTDVSTDQTSVLAVISRFLRCVDKTVDNLDDNTGLWGAGLGLDSLEAAELSAMLEDAFGTDPLSAEGPMPESVGDIVGFYAAPATP